MRDYRIRASNEIVALIRGMHPELKRIIKSTLRIILKDPTVGKALKEELEGLRSYRVRKLRIVYRVVAEKKEIQLIAIGPRENIYRETYRLLKTEK
jgi:mRNA interferase RelE/StbE